jgi:hypothetical protein
MNSTKLAHKVETSLSIFKNKSKIKSEINDFTVEDFPVNCVLQCSATM